uniref:Ig-like domain-containing protein n=1 Tax=Anopheles atroparvus TaxID=41427 RepID=A0A182JF46_ANOAO
MGSSSTLPLFLQCGAEQQKFRTKPVDLVVPEGSDALLRCEIHNAAGSVQWTKDGFALGFTQSIPGYPRYSVLGDSSQGIYNLRIVNVTLDDDAEYQCQVGPYMHHILIRATAKLTVIEARVHCAADSFAAISSISSPLRPNMGWVCVTLLQQSCSQKMEKAAHSNAARWTMEVKNTTRGTQSAAEVGVEDLLHAMLHPPVEATEGKL